MELKLIGLGIGISVLCYSTYPQDVYTFNKYYSPVYNIVACTLIVGRIYTHISLNQKKTPNQLVYLI